MSPFVQNELQGALFKNDKGTGPTAHKRPDYRGQARVGGVNYRLSAWVRTDRNGKKFMSIAFTDDMESNGNAPESDVPIESEDFESQQQQTLADDDISF